MKLFDIVIGLRHVRYHESAEAEKVFLLDYRIIEGRPVSHYITWWRVDSIPGVAH